MDKTVEIYLSLSKVLNSKYYSLRIEPENLSGLSIEIPLTETQLGKLFHSVVETTMTIPENFNPD